MMISPSRSSGRTLRGGASSGQASQQQHCMQVVPSILRANWRLGASSSWQQRPDRLQQCAAGKGFGTSTPRKEDTDDVTSANRPRMRKSRKQMSQSMPSQMQREQLQGQAFQEAVDVQQRVVDQQETAEFSARLQALKAQGEQKRMALPAAGAAAGPAAAAASASSDPSRAAFDQPVESIYDNPPSLQDTMLSQLNSDISDPKLKNANIGPSQLGIAASALVLGLVFVLVAGGDFVPNNRYKGVRPALEAPDSVQQGIIKTRISQLEEQLRITPGAPEPTQALALSYAQLFEFDKAANLLDQLVAKQPNLPDAWRLLGETSLLGEQAGRAVKAYERAVQLRDDDLQIATGLVDAYIANGQQAKAVDYVRQLKTKLPAPTTTTTTSAASSLSSGEASPSTSAPEPEAAASSTSGESAPVASTSAPASASSTTTSTSTKQRAASRAIRPLEPVSLDLLLAKTYSQWRGHDGDAIATYDSLIAAFPEDFRGYLAKGVFLREKGRRADAERMFLQARFYAPENRQRFVKDTVETTPVVDLPDNN